MTELDTIGIGFGSPPNLIFLVLLSAGMATVAVLLRVEPAGMMKVMQ